MTGKKRIHPEDEEEIFIPSIGENDSVNFLKWVRVQDWYFVKRQQKWFHSDGSLLSEEELFTKFKSEQDERLLT